MFTAMPGRAEIALKRKEGNSQHASICIVLLTSNKGLLASAI
jgi:hypothetical protein